MVDRDFSLAGLLRLRKLRDDQAAQQLRHARSRASELAARRTQVREAQLSGEPDALTAASLRAVAISRASTASMLADLRTLQDAQQQAVAGAEAQHRAARTDLRAVEKLEERHAEQVRVEDERAEQVVLDEIASRRRTPGLEDG